MTCPLERLAEYTGGFLYKGGWVRLCNLDNLMRGVRVRSFRARESLGREDERGRDPKEGPEWQRRLGGRNEDLESGSVIHRL